MLPIVRSLIFTGLVGFTACSSNHKDDQEQPAKTMGTAQGFKAPPSQAGETDRYSPIVEPGVPLGMGFAVDLNNHTGIPNKCVEGTLEDVPMQEGYFSLDADYTREDIEKSLGVSASGSYSAFTWGGSARASYAQKMREQSYGLNYVVFAYNKDHSKVFIPTSRSEAWKQSSQEEFLTSCGAGYVAAQDYGSMLFLKFSLILDQKDEEKNFGAGASGSYMGIAKLKASISANTRTKKATGKLSVSAFQIGGKPAELGKILKTNADGGLIESFALCDVSDIPKCLEGLRSIENYVANVYPAQIDDKEKGGSALLTTYPFLYPKNIGPEFNPGVDQFVLKARKDLSDLYNAEMDDLVKLKAFARPDDTDAQKIMTDAQKNVSEIRSATELCYRTSTYKQCAQRSEELTIACAATNVPEGFGVGDSREGNKGNDSDE